MEVRMPRATRIRLEEVNRITDPEKAVRQLIDLFFTTFRYEEKRPVEYDPATGQPTQHKWVPNGKWAPIVYLSNTDLQQPVKEFLKNIMNDNKIYVLEHDGHDYSISAYYEDYPDHFSHETHKTGVIFKKLTPLKFTA